MKLLKWTVLERAPVCAHYAADAAPVTVFILINLINGAFNIFPQVYFITKGGPMDQTQVIPS